MQVPFPVLTSLDILSNDQKAPIIPAGFLGGSALRLRAISFDGIPFPTLPMLLLSTSNLVTLTLSEIPPAGYIPPDAMAVGLAALTKLEKLVIDFQWVTFSHGDKVYPHPVTRIILPALKTFTFYGACTYLDNLVARIDSPRLNRILISSANQLFDVSIAQLTKYLDRSMASKLTLLRHAKIGFSSYHVTFKMYDPSSLSRISCEWIDLQVSNLAQSFCHLSTTISNVVHLKLEVMPEVSPLEELVEGADDIEWLRLLRQFSAIQSLYVSLDFAELIALALEDINTEMVLPFLNLNLRGPTSIIC
jgi:hypothetical protein